MNENITFKRSTLWKISTFVFAALFVISIFTGGFVRESSGDGIAGNVGAPSVPNQPSIPTGIASVNAEDYADDDPFIGNKNAPVTMIEFSDFQCPFCARFRDQTFDQLKAEYIDTGKVKFVYRDLPLTSIHSMAQPAAEAAECVRDYAKGSNEAYFKMHDKIFAGQTSLSNENLKLWAKDLGYDIGSCLDY